MKCVAKILFMLFLITFAYAQTKQIGIWVEYVDYTGEYVNIISALDAATEFDYELHEFWNYLDITSDDFSALDVFIVPELERSSSMGRPGGLQLGPIMRPWVDGGGLFIAMYSHGKDFLCAAGFDSIGGTTGYTTGSILTVILPEHPLAEGVAPTFNGMNASNAYSYYGSYTPVITNASAYMHTGFQEFGAGAVVFFGWDYYDAITPNQDRLFQNAISIWGNASEGPILRTFFPENGSVYAGYPTIRMEFQDDDGINISSFQFYLNGVLFTGHDPIVSAVGDTVFIEVPDTLADGEVSIRIRRIEDILGNEGPDTVRVNSFFIDNTPPELVYYEPSDILTHIPDGAMIIFSDDASGTSDENWYFYFEGADTIRKGRTGVITEGDTLVLIAFSLVGVNPSPNDTNWVEFGVWDTPDAGTPNIERYRWWFLPAVGIEERLPESMDFTVSPTPFNSACKITAPKGSIVEIFDISGRSVADMKIEGETNWSPTENTSTGIYLFRSEDTSGNISIKRVVYLK